MFLPKGRDPLRRSPMRSCGCAFEGELCHRPSNSRRRRIHRALTRQWFMYRTGRRLLKSAASVFATLCSGRVVFGKEKDIMDSKRPKFGAKR